MRRHELADTVDRTLRKGGYSFTSPTSVRTERSDGGLLVDFAVDGRAIGVEITSPSKLDLSQLNRVLARLGHEAARPEDLAPLVAA